MRHDRDRAEAEIQSRDVNESIDQEQEERGDPGPRWVVCECARPDCAELVDVGPENYHRVRSHPQRFVVLRGHEQPDIETIVETHQSYLVVEKTGEAGRVAREDAQPG